MISAPIYQRSGNNTCAANTGGANFRSVQAAIPTRISSRRSATARRVDRRIASHAALDQHLLDLADRLRGVETLGAGVGAVHDGVAAIEPERVFQIVQALAGLLVAAVG